MKKIMILAITILLIACKKDEPKQYSYWTVNGQEYNSNNVEAVEGQNRPLSILASHDQIRFDLRFQLGYFPIADSWPLATAATIDQPMLATLGFYLGNKPYIASGNNTNQLGASTHNNKARYTLPPTWFVNYYDSGDSVLISGTFNEP